MSERESYEAIEQRRNDPAFAERLRRRMEQDKPILDRLAEQEAEGNQYTAEPAAVMAHLSREVSRANAERDALAATVQRVRDLHSQDTSLLAPGKWCPACGDETPCPTIRALDATATDGCVTEHSPATNPDCEMAPDDIVDGMRSRPEDQEASDG